MLQILNDDAIEQFAAQILHEPFVHRIKHTPNNKILQFFF